MFVLIGLVWKRFELPGEEIGERWAAFCFVARPRSALPFVTVTGAQLASSTIFCVQIFSLVGQNPQSNLILTPPCCNNLAVPACSCVK